MDLTKAEDIKKRWQEYTEYTEELYKNNVNDPANKKKRCDSLPRARHPKM